jgi:hypothetical protein
MIDPARPETFKLSEEAWVRYLSKDERIRNSTVRSDRSKSVLQAMRENREHYKAMTVDGESVHEIIKGL